MKKLLRLLFFAVFLSGMLAACSDDPYYGEGMDSEYNRLYSNKEYTAQPGAGKLELTYSGGEVFGKDVYFEMQDPNTANLKFFGIFPAESETALRNVSLRDNGREYVFSAEGVSEKGTTYSAAGSLSGDTLRIELTNVHIPANPLTGNYRLPQFTVGYDAWTETIADTPTLLHTVSYTVTERSYPFYLDWRVNMTGEEQSLFAELQVLVDALVGNLLYLVLPEVTFHADGNVTAKYASLPSDLDIMSLLGASATEDMRGPVTESPINLCHYFVEDSVVTIRPDVEMIMRLIMSNNSKSDEGAAPEEGETSGLNIMDLISDLLEKLYRWSNEGIRFTLKDVAELPESLNTHSYEEGWSVNNPNLYRIQEDYMLYEYVGKYALYAGIDELKFVVDLVPTLLNLIEIDNALLGMLIGGLEEMAPYTSTFNVGIILDNE